MIKNIIFDVGRVLVDYDYISFLERRYSEEEQKIIREAMFENEMWLVGDRGTLETEKLVNGFVSNAPEHEALIRDAYAHADECIWLKPYALEWVKALKEKGFHLYILSNYGKDLFERTREKMPFLDYMDGAVFSYECHFLKPEPEAYLNLCKKYGLLSGESIFIDDSEPNIQACRQFGIHGILFTDYESAKEQVEHLIESYANEDRMGFCCE